MALTKETASAAATPQGATNAGTGSMPWFGMEWWQGMAQIGSEMSSFMADRLREDLKTQHALMHCTTLAEIQAVQAGFVARAVDDYTAETGKLVEIGQGFLTGAQTGPS